MERNRGVPDDPSGIQEPHDVLAAEEFGIGARDDRLPPDPSGRREAHDVLAAEEFAMPAGADGTYGVGAGSASRGWLAAVAGIALLALVWRRRRAG
ncbi:MAG TPA: hypothetical protein VGF21_14760 [Thermoleophilaceae bacterium]|jgi:hypothetical protein